ncbi:MAG: hypothetical protein A2289_12310 [Deltaproteobacteria bacterium RIFOXYA12_FULL_58_15]|nr:MAG: hypothetical protein A2289_12310 [Deltaproteobacteria bacterium RIFOXYA12_FULL_58_15]
MMLPLFALTTDFGPSSPYVAQMKGVILSGVPNARIVDVSHAIPPQSIRAAEVVLRSCAFCMPTGTVHVVVVDPGVGTDRRAIAVSTAGTVFVGPDNGVLGQITARPDAMVVALDNRALFRQPVSSTFHGRDIFAPVAVELACGLSLTDVGTPIDDPVASTLPKASARGNVVCGETLCADHFGNLLTNIPWRAANDARITVGGVPARVVETYGKGGDGELLAVGGSDGFLEIAMKQARASDLFGNGVEVLCGR